MPSIKTILNNLDRKVINVGVTATGTFTYENDDPVKAGIPFHMYYTTDKQEIFATGADYDATSKFIIRIVGKTPFAEYIDAKRVKSTTFLTASPPKIKNKDYDVGFVNRYFARQANDRSKVVFEISKKDYRKTTPFYIKETIVWTLTGNESDVIASNLDEVLYLRGFFEKPSFSLPLLAHWQPTVKTKRDEVLSRINF